MIIGVGIDIVEVADMARRLDNPSFLKVFSEREQAYAAGRGARRAAILASRWAGKEAFGKALGTGLRAEWPLSQIEILHAAGGRPTIELGPALQALLPPAACIHCSLSHTAAYATACVIIESG